MLIKDNPHYSNLIMNVRDRLLLINNYLFRPSAEHKPFNCTHDLELSLD